VNKFQKLLLVTKGKNKGQSEKLFSAFVTELL